MSTDRIAVTTRLPRRTHRKLEPIAANHGVNVRALVEAWVCAVLNAASASTTRVTLVTEPHPPVVSTMPKTVDLGRALHDTSVPVTLYLTREQYQVLQPAATRMQVTAGYLIGLMLYKALLPGQDTTHRFTITKTPVQPPAPTRRPGQWVQESDLPRLRELFSSSTPMKEIAREFNFSQPTVYAWRDRFRAEANGTPIVLRKRGTNKKAARVERTLAAAAGSTSASPSRSSPPSPRSSRRRHRCRSSRTS